MLFRTFGQSCPRGQRKLFRNTSEYFRYLSKYSISNKTCSETFQNTLLKKVQNSSPFLSKSTTKLILKRFWNVSEPHGFWFRTLQKRFRNVSLIEKVFRNVSEYILKRFWTNCMYLCYTLYRILLQDVTKVHAVSSEVSSEFHSKLLSKSSEQFKRGFRRDFRRWFWSPFETLAKCHLKSLWNTLLKDFWVTFEDFSEFCSKDSSKLFKCTSEGTSEDSSE
jgi:hypothetical protein